MATVEAPDTTSVLDAAPVPEAPEPTPPAAQADRSPPAPPEAPVDRPPPGQTAPERDDPALSGPADSSPPAPHAPAGAAPSTAAPVIAAAESTSPAPAAGSIASSAPETAAPATPRGAHPGTAVGAAHPVEVEHIEATEEADEAEEGEAEDVREARRGRLVVAVGLGTAVVLAVGLLALGGADGFDEPPSAPVGLARVEGVVTLASAQLGPGGVLDPPPEPLTRIPAGTGAALHLRYAEERAELADALGVVWYRGGTELYRTSWRLAQPIGAWRADLPPQNTMATGDYRADVVVNGAVVHSVPFAVTEGEEDASGAPAAPAGR